MSDFRSEARRWLAAEPDADMREELESLLAGPDDELSVRFDGRLQFGTAGLRAAVGAGPQRMNRLVVQQAAAGLVDYLLKAEPDAASRGVIIGYDARRKSDAFALDTARVCAARGVIVEVGAEKQKEGRKRMRQYGKVEIPQSAFLAALKMGDE